MRRFIRHDIATLLLVGVLTVPASGQGQLNLSGTWSLDRAGGGAAGGAAAPAAGRGGGPTAPQVGTGGARVIAGGSPLSNGGGRVGIYDTLVITQTADELRVQGENWNQTPLLLVFKLDQSETTTTGPGGTTKTKLTRRGDKLVLSSVRTFMGPQGAVSVELEDVYGVAERRLTIERTRGGSAGTYVYRAGAIPLVERVAAAAPDRPAARKAGPIPRLASGKPDLQGHWSPRAGVASIEGVPGTFGFGGGRNLIVDPPGKRLPYREWALAERDRRNSNIREDPEAHCFVSGMPRQMLRGPYQILQTADSVVILFEYMHASRDVPLNRRSHLPLTFKPWEGDATGRWEGDTLVVEVTNVNGKSWLDAQGNFVSDGAHLTERFTPVDANTIDYEVTVDDAKVYTRPWKMAFPLEREQEDGFKLLEEACQEGPREGIDPVAAPSQ